MVHTFELHGLRLALDVESGSLHVLDEPAWFAVRRLAAGMERQQVIMDMSALFGTGVPTAVMAEIAKLREQGLLFSPAAELGAEGEGAVKALCLHLSHDCDLRCSYCFASTGHYGGERGLMSEQAAKNAVDFLMRESKTRRHCEIDFFGGEPLLNFEVLKKTVAYGKELALGLGKILKFTITTNGLSLGRSEREYLNKENISIVLSLDGRKEVHDRLRRLPDGSGSFDLVLSNARSLHQERKGENYYLRGTFTALNPDFSADVLALLSFGFKRISLEPAVLPDGHSAALKQENLELLMAEYERLALLLWERESRGERVYFFHFELELKLGHCLKKRAAGCGAGAAYLAVAPDGTLYPCHQFVGQAGFKAGHVKNGKDETVLEPFGRLGMAEKKGCHSCFARYFCGGGCHASAWLQNGNLAKPYLLGCLLHRKRVECGLYLQAKRMLHDAKR